MKFPMRSVLIRPISILSGLLVVNLLTAPLSASAADGHPNIVLILADDLGWADTTLYGKTSLYETPNIERLAARGMTFTDAYAASPICSPTRASIMSGQNPARHGMTAPAAHLPEVRFEPIANTGGLPHQKCTNVKSATRLDPSIPTLAQLLKGAGYSTAHFGKWHLGLEPHSPLELGFDVDIPHWHGPGPKTSYLAPWRYDNPNFKEGEPGEHIEDRMAKEAVAWLKKRKRTKPFYMNYWQFSVHAPFGAKPELIDRYRKKIKCGEAQQSPTYAAMVHSLDDAVGSLLDALDAEGIADETVIVFYSDNGGNIHCGLEETDASGENYITAITSNLPLRGGKGGIHDGGIRVPAVVVWPGVTEPGSLSNTRIQSTDLYPTILRMLNVERPTEHVIDGIDFTTALKGKAVEREPMFTFVPSYGNTPQWLPPSMAVHYGHWKLIRTFHHGKDGNHDYRLYNLREDIGENNNLAADHPEKVKVMDQLIEDYVAEANVVVPLPNPNFDPAKFDPKTIGVQKGGLKMPPAPKTPGAAAPQTIVNRSSMLGWTARNADISVGAGSLKIASTSRNPLLVNNKMGIDGPVEFSLRIRAQVKGTARLQWRTQDQQRFPPTGQSKTFALAGGDWQELTVPLPVKGRLVHVRFIPPTQKRPIEIDWIKIGTAGASDQGRKRWDFNASTNTGPTKPRLKPQAKTEPNIVFILADDLGYGELACYDGPDVKSPNLDRLAKNGVRFTSGYSAFPVCSPSRAAILTGRYPARIGPSYEDYFGGGAPGLDPERHTTISQLMKEAGYRTGCFGKWNVSHQMLTPPNAFGFDRWVGFHWNHDFYTHRAFKGDNPKLDMFVDGENKDYRPGVWSDTIFADEAIAFIKDNKEEPFFVYLPFQAPHAPIQDPDVPFGKIYDKKDIKNRPIHIKMIERLDLEVGRVLQTLEDEGLVDNTLVIFTSDNGGAQFISRNLPLNGAKQMLLEGGVRVPLIMRWPNKLPVDEVYADPVSAMDLTATVASAASVSARADQPFDGVDILPALTGQGELDANRPLFFRRRTVVYWKGQNRIRQSAVRQGDWKYLRTYRGEKYEETLYNLKDDLGETKDLAQSNPEKLHELEKMLADWEAEMAETAAVFPAKK